MELSLFPMLHSLCLVCIFFLTGIQTQTGKLFRDCSLGSFDREKQAVSDCMANSLQNETENNQVETNSNGWSDFAPQLVSKEVIASSECATNG